MFLFIFLWNLANITNKYENKKNYHWKNSMYKIQLYPQTNIGNQPQPPSRQCKLNGDCGLTREAEKEVSGNKGVAGSTKPPTFPPSVTGTVPATTFAPDTTTTTDNLRQQNLDRFCRFRDDGPHSIPTICDIFIYCVNGIGSYETCKNGTKFNPEVLGCDHAINFECSFSGLDCKYKRSTARGGNH